MEKSRGSVVEERGKKLNLFNIISLGVGGGIGSGIFVMMGFGIAYTGRSIVLAVSVGCIYMLLAYLYHPVMASMFVTPGGDYDMKAMLMGPHMTGVSALMTFIMGLGISSYSIAFASYFVSVFTGLASYQRAISVILVLGFFALSVKGTKVMATITSIITVVLLLSIGIFIVVGLPQVKPGFFASTPEAPFFLNGWSGFIGAIAIMSFACQGSTHPPISVMTRTKNPRKTVPAGLLIITIIIGIVYGLMSIVAAGVLPLEQVMGQNLSLVAGAIFTPVTFVVFILGAACCAIASSLSAGMTMLRYPLLSVVEDGWLPKCLGKTTKDGYPYVLMGIFLAITLLPIFTPVTVDTLVSLTLVPLMLTNVYMNIKLIALPKKYPKQWENAIFRMPMPLFYVLCVLGAVCALAVAYYLFVDMDLISRILCAVMVAAMILITEIRIRQGAVNIKDLDAKRERIATAAIAATEAEDA